MSDDVNPEGDVPENDVPDRFSVDFTGLTLLGTYEVRKKMADGGMGSVYLGHDTNLDRRVVIKVPHVRFLGEPGFRSRFAREISELVRLEHPNIVRILAQGEHEEVPYFVLQFLGGGSLEEVFDAREGAGSAPEDYLRWLRTIAQTLDFVHARGTVHRDVKPANVLFDDEGHVFLSDFGVAKAMENEDANLTEAGTGIGSPRYMAPEQGFGHDLTPSADQYALASMVYEAAAGRPPFLETSPIELLVKKGGSDPEPLGDLVPELPAASSDAVMRALSRDPGERHPSCAAFVEAFEAGFAPAPEPVAAPPAARRRLALAALALVPLLVAVFLFNRDKSQRAPADGATNEAGHQRLALIDAGAEPRMRLRYGAKAGTGEKITISLLQVTEMKIAGQEVPMPPNPGVVFDITLRIEDVASNGDIHVSWKTDAVRYESTEAPSPEIQALLDKLRKHYLEFAGTTVFAANGLTRQSELANKDTMSSAVRSQIESLWWVVRNAAMPFPVEPVGVGARWEVTESVDLVGMRVTDTTTLELVEIDEGGFSLKFFSAQTGAEQKVTTFDRGEHKMDATLESLHARGKGTAAGDLRRVTPSNFAFDLVMDVRATFANVPAPDGSKGVKSELHVDLTMKVARTGSD